MIDFEEWAKYLLYPLGKKTAALLAKLGIACLWVIISGFILALPISHLAYQMMGASSTTSLLYILGNYVAILASIILCAILGCLFPWCHCVLLYQRGWDITRGLSTLSLLASLFIGISTLWSALFGSTLLPNQILAPFMVLALLCLGLIGNWGNMAALSLWRRIGLNITPMLLILELLLGLCGLYLFAMIAYLPIFFLLRPALQWLAQHAERIVELPPLPDEKKNA